MKLTVQRLDVVLLFNVFFFRLFFFLPTDSICYKSPAVLRITLLLIFISGESRTNRHREDHSSCSADDTTPLFSMSLYSISLLLLNYSNHCTRTFLLFVRCCGWYEFITVMTVRSTERRRVCLHSYEGLGVYLLYIRQTHFVLESKASVLLSSDFFPPKKSGPLILITLFSIL